MKMVPNYVSAKVYIEFLFEWGQTVFLLSAISAWFYPKFTCSLFATHGCIGFEGKKVTANYLIGTIIIYVQVFHTCRSKIQGKLKILLFCLISFKFGM